VTLLLGSFSLYNINLGSRKVRACRIGPNAYTRHIQAPPVDVYIRTSKARKGMGEDARQLLLSFGTSLLERY
jgi:hypothetical protein